MSADPDAFDGLDLDADRQSRAAAREGHNKPLPIRFGGQVITTLPVELPLDVLAPLRDIDDDLALMIRAIMQAMQAAGEQATMTEATNLVVDLLVSNPQLPTKLLDTVRRVSVNLLTQEGFDAYMAMRPSREDMGALAKGVFRFYGVSLGESSAPSGSQDDGGATSNTTSDTNSGSTPEASTPTPETPGQESSDQQPRAS